MLVVPLKGDKITTKDNSDPQIVSSYSSLKDEPAVYLKNSSDQFVYFTDIVEINGVRVEYDSTSNLFNALGPLRRAFNLPQPKDTIKVKLMDVSFRDDIEEMEVTSIKLHMKKYGVERGLLVCTKEGCFSLSDIEAIDHKSISENFDPVKFKRYYFDYYPILNRGKKNSS
jgi:hypothetical protein